MDRFRTIRITGLGIAWTGLLACAEAPSVQVARPANPPAQTLVRDVAVLDVESGTRVSNRETSGRIDGSGSALIDGSGATLVPGLIDMHGHLNSGTAPSWEFAFPDPEANLRSYLYAGVTSVLAPGDSSAEAFERRRRVAEGDLVGPRIYSAGTLITCNDGHPVALVRELQTHGVWECVGPDGYNRLENNLSSLMLPYRSFKTILRVGSRP